MARKPRYYVPGVACHVIQRGNNRFPCFFTRQDFRNYLECLRDALDEYGCELHAYALMTNHVHLLMTPRKATGVARTMQSLGRQYVRYFNHRYRHTGTPWEGQHRGSLVDSRYWLLLCQRYIELNPVRAGMVEVPGEYAWSSYRANAYGRPDPLLTPHPEYAGLGGSREARQSAYRELFREHIADEDLHALRAATELNAPIGSERFRAAVERRLKTRAGERRRDRAREPLEA